MFDSPGLRVLKEGLPDGKRSDKKTTRGGNQDGGKTRGGN